MGGYSNAAAALAAAAAVVPAPSRRAGCRWAAGTAAQPTAAPAAATARMAAAQLQRTERAYGRCRGLVQVGSPALGERTPCPAWTPAWPRGRPQGAPWWQVIVRLAVNMKYEVWSMKYEVCSKSMGNKYRK